VVGKRYSVSSRLIGHRLRVRLYASEIEVVYQALIGRYPRLCGHDAYHIDYRHLIHSLIRKPEAFRRYCYREALFPTIASQRCYDTLCERSTRWGGSRVRTHPCTWRPRRWSRGSGGDRRPAT
jgi:hypothetical protein